MNQQEIEQMVAQVMARLQTGPDMGIQDIETQEGIFDEVDAAVSAASKAQKALTELKLEEREKIIRAMRQAVEENVELIAKTAVEETGLGRYEDKVKKNLLAARKTPGTEDICPRACTGDYGFTLEERAPYGVIGSITPSTNPSETVICNGIGMIAAGNAVVFNSHPGAKKVTRLTIELLNRAIRGAGGPPNLLCGVENPTIETGDQLMHHPGVRILVVTGGPGIVKAAMNSGKKVIGADPGNPPVVVDETADIPKAAKDIVDGASFDNNVLCIAEKEVFVVREKARELVTEMIKQGAYLLKEEELERLMPKIAQEKNGRLAVNRRYVGKDAGKILEAIGLKVDDRCRLAVAVTGPEHPLVYLEQLMPVLPVVPVRDVEEAIMYACEAEAGCYHTAMMHSMNVEHLSKMAKAANTSIFVKNAPSYAGLGMEGEGHATFTIASPTGEGLTSPISFTRQRRCVLKDQFRIV